MKISIVLLTYNGEKTLNDLLTMIPIQDIKLDVELVAVDSGSTDNSIQLLENFNFRVVSIQKKIFNFGTVRDYAFSITSGEIIVTLSQDVIPKSKSFLSTIIEPIISSRADVVQGRTESDIYKRKSFLWHRDRSIFYFTSEAQIFEERHGNIGLSCECIAIRRDAWLDTLFSGSPYCEDKLIQVRLYLKNYRLYEISKPIGWHNHNYEAKSLIFRCYNEGVGWRYAGNTYKFKSCMKDMTIGFFRYYKIWIKSFIKGDISNFAEFFFFQIRPLSLFFGNRFGNRPWFQ